MTGNTKYGHKREGNIRHGEHRTDSTPPSRTVRPAPYTIQRGGGVGALEALRDMETGQDRRPPGRRPFWEPWRSGEVGRPWRIHGLGRPWRVRELGRPWRSRELRVLGSGPGHPGRGYMAPPPKFSWGSFHLVGVLEERSPGGALEERVPGGALEERALGGARQARTLEGARQARTLEGARQARTLEGARQARTPEGAGEERALGCAGEERALGCAGEERALGCAGEERALGCAGEERALGCAGEERALGCALEDTGVEQPLEGTGVEQPLEGTGVEQPLEGTGAQGILGLPYSLPAGKGNPRAALACLREPRTTAGWFWLGAGHSPDTGGSLPSILVRWCLGGPRDDGNWPRARTERGW